MAILVTGGSGFLGKALIPRLLSKGHKVYSLSRHPPAPSENLVPLVGDILQPNLGLSEVPGDIHAIHHLAAIHRLGVDKDGSIWQTNVEGTKNVLEFCAKHKISQLCFTSSAYTQGRNTYEQSKALCETLVRKSDIPRVVIFKPSIVMGTEENFYPGHFSQFVSLVIKVHQRAELIRRKVEGTLRLPVIEPVLRIKANPEAKLNLVPVDVITHAMVNIERPETYWLTHPDPPTIGQLVRWIGKSTMVKIKIEHTFKATPIEAIFSKMTAAFTPYLWGDNFPSDIKKCPSITQEFINDTIKRGLQLDQLLIKV